MDKRPPSLNGRGSLWIACDEFTATLDRTLAKVVAFNLRKQARAGRRRPARRDDPHRHHRRLETDLLVRCEEDIHPVRHDERRPHSFAHELSIAEGTQADWKRF